MKTNVCIYYDYQAEPAMSNPLSNASLYSKR